MTVGDGNSCRDALYLSQFGADVLATDIKTEALLRAKTEGIFAKVQFEDCHVLSAKDESFDFVFCKESYHHFSRPPVAFYEMLRVCKKAVILIEPRETCQPLLYDKLKNLTKKIRGDKSLFYEPEGNYIFRVNLREIEKMMMALGYQTIAYQFFNDFYLKRHEEERYHHFSLATILAKSGILTQDIFCRLRLLNFGLVSLVVFKEPPSRHALAYLRNSGFRIRYLARNPYIDQAK
jgi:SAM-dependent methyltransferase